MKQTVKTYMKNVTKIFFVSVIFGMFIAVIVMQAQNDVDQEPIQNTTSKRDTQKNCKITIPESLKINSGEHKDLSKPKKNFARIK